MQITFFHNARHDGGIRMGIELDGETTLIDDFLPGPPEFENDPLRLGRCSGTSISVAEARTSPPTLRVRGDGSWLIERSSRTVSTNSPRKSARQQRRLDASKDRASADG